MYQAFENIDREGPVWIFAFNRKISLQERNTILKAMEIFLNQWESHKKDITSNCSIIDDIAMVISTDVSDKPSGCALDKLYRKIQETEKELNIEMLNRFNIPIRKNQNEVKIVNLSVLRSLEHETGQEVLNLKAQKKAQISDEKNRWVRLSQLL